MEVRLKTARATKDIDLTSLKRLKRESDLLSAMVLEEFRALAQLDLGDFSSVSLLVLTDLSSEDYQSSFHQG